MDSKRGAADARSAATLLDCLLALPCLLAASPAIRASEAAGLPAWLSPVLGLIAWTLSAICLFAAFEASWLRATPGKLACGLVVTRSDGSRVGFRLAFRRNLAKYSFLIPGAFVLMRSGWAPAGARHDRSIGTMVILRDGGAAA